MREPVERWGRYWITGGGMSLMEGSKKVNNLLLSKGKEERAEGENI